MTPGARVAAAIEILDEIMGGVAAERALTGWARASRFAGSKDRAAIRDYVFDVLRAKSSLAARAGGTTGRALMIGLVARDGADFDALFNGVGHAPMRLVDTERDALSVTRASTLAEATDIPEWLWPMWSASLGDQAEVAAREQQKRAPVYLRVNARRCDPVAAAKMLLDDGILVEQHSDVKNCLRVVSNERKIKNSTAYFEGYLELQDAASQEAAARVAVPAKGKILDYCSGGGGKALAFADLFDVDVFAHDIAPERMRDLSARAARARVDVTAVLTADLQKAGPFDVVFCDAPCSGSGTWRRTPDAKWRLTPDKLRELNKAQLDVIQSAARLVSDNGTLIYATCSVLNCENEEVVEGFCKANAEWQITDQMKLAPSSKWDGFFSCSLKKN